MDNRGRLSRKDNLPVSGQYELPRIRQGQAEATKDNKKALARRETTMKELVERKALLEQQMGHMEERLGNTDDRIARLERLVVYLLHQRAKLTAKCDDLESRSRRNIRIHGLPEGSEKTNTIGFVTDFIRSSLQVSDYMDIRIERAHRSLTTKPKETNAPRELLLSASETVG